ncbi:hypothetical protein MMUR_44250 [Mycolicibacterium murale]|uniref:Uncharacterized protein n=1 Tax=Mycolicibacterium murale TaxID=182220 RepID=A0A7I9WRV0_9MYCO|nr:hypothetical protein MTOK_41900 [Mycolicibacterium tokaiense]GFG60289.1 hypothetical protein MMUR_44250 [Mycolicibacterium murale]
MWEQHAVRIVGDAGLPPQRGRQSIFGQVQQYQIGPPAEQPIGGQVYLLRGRKMNETNLGQ